MSANEPRRLTPEESGVDQRLLDEHYAAVEQAARSPRAATDPTPAEVETQEKAVAAAPEDKAQRSPEVKVRR